MESRLKIRLGRRPADGADRKAAMMNQLRADCHVPPPPLLSPSACPHFACTPPAPIRLCVPTPPRPATGCVRPATHPGRSPLGPAAGLSIRRRGPGVRRAAADARARVESILWSGRITKAGLTPVTMTAVPDPSQKSQPRRRKPAALLEKLGEKP